MPDFMKRLLIWHRWVEISENCRRCSVCGREEMEEDELEVYGPSSTMTVSQAGDFLLHWPVKKPS